MLKGSSASFINIDPQNTVVQAMSQAKCENICHETESWSYTEKPCFFKKRKLFSLFMKKSAVIKAHQMQEKMPAEYRNI